jgi:TorA maturation chaperone TorD
VPATSPHAAAAPQAAASPQAATSPQAAATAAAAEDLDAQHHQLLAGAAVTFAALGLLIYREPVPEDIAKLLADDYFSALPFANDNQNVACGLEMLRAWAKDARTRDLAELTCELGREWLRLLVGYGEPKAPPWAAYYSEKDPVIFGQKTLAVREWYRRHDLQLEHKYREPDDHLGIMLQFLAKLIWLELDALERSDAELAQQLAEEQQLFIRENLSTWVPHWQQLLAQSARSPFYNGLSLLIVGSLEGYLQVMRHAGCHASLACVKNVEVQS